MSDRYQRLFSLESNIYFAGSPLIIEAGALLKDNNDNRLIAQLKILSISEKTIIAVKIRINGKDAFDSSLNSQEYQYLDIDVQRNQEFGQQTAIVLEDKNTRSFSVSIIEVVFSDKSKWENMNEDAAQFLNAKTLFELLNDQGLVKQYGIDNGGKCNFVPTSYDDLWLCTCGAFNHISEKVCNSCKKDKSQLESEINIDRLKEERDLFLKKKAYSEAKELIESESLNALNEAKGLLSEIGDYEDAQQLVVECDNKINEISQRNQAKEATELKKNKKIKIISISVASVICVVVLSLALVNIIIPNYKYYKAQSYLEHGKYDEAIDMYNKLGDYKDSELKVSEVQLQRGIHLIEEHKYDEADRLLVEIINYKNAKDYLGYISGLKWYEEEFSSNEKYGAFAISKKVELLSKVHTKLGEEYTNNLLNYLYSMCEDAFISDSYVGLEESLEYLIKMNYRVNECEEMKNNYNTMFSSYDGTYYSVSRYSVDKIEVSTNLKTGTITFSDYFGTFDLNSKHIYSWGDYDYEHFYELKNGKLYVTTKEYGKITYGPTEYQKEY